MHYGQFIKLFCALLLLVMGFLSFSSYAQEESQDPQYSFYLQAIERARQKEAAEMPVESPKSPVLVQDKKVETKENAERVCLAGEFCMNADFSDVPTPHKLFERCKEFSSEYPSENEVSRAANDCYVFLFAFSDALNISSFVNKTGSLDKKLCIGGVAEDFPRRYVDFMNENPELFSKNSGYSVLRFFEETFQCVDKE